MPAPKSATYSPESALEPIEEPHSDICEKANDGFTDGEVITTNDDEVQLSDWLSQWEERRKALAVVAQMMAVLLPMMSKVLAQRRLVRESKLVDIVLKAWEKSMLLRRKCCT